MIVGTPKEIKNQEYRVGLIPAGAQAMTSRGHRVLVQAGAGLGAVSAMKSMWMPVRRLFPPQPISSINPK